MRAARRLLEAWLERRTGPAAEFALGDLEEERRLRADADGSLPAELWYWRQAVGLALRMERRERGGGGVGGWRADLRDAVRALRHRRVYTGVVVLTLALGTGANTAVFSVVDAVLFSPLPYAEPERLVMVWETGPRGGADSPAPANYLDWRERAGAFEHLVAMVSQSHDLTGEGEPLRLEAVAASPELFEMLGVAPAPGWGFRTAEAAPDEAVAVVSHGLWTRRFGADPDLVGRRILLDGRPTAVVGVAPRGFAFPNPRVDLWLPLDFDAEARQQRRSHYLSVAGRLREGVDLESARAELDLVAQQLAAAYPDTNGGRGAEVVPLLDDLVGSARAPMLALLAVAGLLLLLACGNVASLTLAQAGSRARERAIRAALGAGRGRLLRQSLFEGLLLALLGGAAGLALARGALAVLPALERLDVPRLHEVAVDGRALGFALIASTLSGLVFGLLPVGRARNGMAAALGAGGRHGSAPAVRAQSALAVFQGALATVLLLGTGLALHSLARLSGVETGFRSEGVLTLNVRPPGSRYATDEARAEFYRRLLERTRALPGVESAGVVGFLPFTFPGGSVSLGIEGRPEPERVDGREPIAAFRVISPGLLESLGVPLLRGRAFDPAAVAARPEVALIDAAAARRFFPDEEPIGRRVRIGSAAPWLEVIGVVGETRLFALGREPAPTLYVPAALPHPLWASPRALVLRTAGDPVLVAGAARRAVAEVDPLLPVTAVRPFADVVADSIGPRRVVSGLMTAFGLLALALASLGLYGVIAFFVEARQRELGVRVALGASRGRIARIVLGRGLRLAGVGLAIGLLAAAAAARTLEGLVYGIRPTDPPTWAAAAALLLLTAAAASLVPARRALAIDPLEALRDE